MTKFIPELKNISTQLSDSKTKEQQSTIARAIRDEDRASLEKSAQEEPKKRRRGILGAIAQPLLNSRLLDLRNPMYRSRKFWILTTMGVGVTGGAIAVGITWWNLDRSLPDPKEALTFVRDGTLTIKAEDGTIIQQRGEATREKLTLEEMPPLLVQAFIASEDSRFYEHKGVDYKGIGRAIVSNLTARNVVEGGSTITQQLARLVFLSQERTVWRKVKEIMLAQKMEQQLTKQQILERYLNLVYLGEGAYGVTDAAWVYFSKPLEELTLSEIATLVGLTPSPNTFSPIVDGKAAQTRRNLVLQRMQEAGFINAEQARIAIAEPLEIEPAPPKRLTSEAPYFTSFIEQELPRLLPPEAVEAGGLIVETTVNRALQKHGEEVVERAIRRMGRGQRFKQAALVAIDPRSGEVKAMVGGTDFDKTQFNRVTQAMRQPGSTFKGFVYTAAIAAGFSPYRGYLDAPITVDGYTPKNYGETHSGWQSMRDALIKSTNTIAVRALIDVGFDPVIDMAHNMGIDSELKPVYSLALGGVEVNLLELTSGYGTLATKGKHSEVHGIRRVLNQRGEVIYEANTEPIQAVDEESAAIMTWMLRGVVNSGTGSAASLAGRQVAGKTGTSDEARDLWFIGYIPQMVTGVWLGNDDNSPTWGSSSTAALVWRNFMVKAVDGMPIEKFPPRPDKLEGRKGSIKADPIKPGRMIVRRIPRKAEENNENNDNNSRRRRRAAVDNDSTPVQSFRRRSRWRSDSGDRNEASAPAPRRRRFFAASSNSDSSDNQPRIVRRRRSWPTSSSSSSSNDSSPAPRRRRSFSAASSDSGASSQPRRSRRRSFSSSNSSDSGSSRRRSFSSSGSSSSGSSRRRSFSSGSGRRSSGQSVTRRSRRSSAPAAGSAAPAPAAPSIDFKSHH